MDEQNSRKYHGEEDYYSRHDKLKPSTSRLSQRLILIFISITTVLLVIVIVFGVIIVHLLTSPSQNSSQSVTLSTPIPPTASLNGGATPTVVVPTPSPVATPVPTATSLPTVGTVLCQPKASDWPQTSDWQTVGTEYVNKDGNSTPVIASCNISVSNYYVEAKIRTSQSNFGALMGVLARLSLEKKTGYKGGISYATFCGENCGQAELDDLLNSQQAMAHFGSLYTNTAYTVKLQVKGTDVTLYVNSNLVQEQHYTSANDAGQVGIECDQACEVLQFTVVAQ